MTKTYSLYAKINGRWTRVYTESSPSLKVAREQFADAIVRLCAAKIAVKLKANNHD